MGNWNDSHAISYDERWGELEFHRKIPGLAKVEPGYSILELGCGGGFLAICLAQSAQSVKVSALDPTEKMIALANERKEKADLRSSQIQFIQAGAEQRVAEDTSLDLVIAAFSVHHWQQPKLAMSTIFNGLKSGGRIWICEDLNMPIEGDLEVDTSLKAYEGIRDLLGSSGFVSIIRSLSTSDEGEFLIVEATKP
ncbi:MAG: class I SAM-dependent methyltransferase [Kangiellaceae bacterium]|nr:class I SAM-dependent methyltransferase [Kangiellaceae bacterium]MCW9000320.1 class I SAM-dependent methyltransferase [Kangiellaceae bacterium]MCW9016446.1 class I SAM-dependent methyltransferase [Kangiellaceae bacterium]